MINKISFDELASFCKKKGFVYQNSEIYGGIAGFFDYGPLGVELKNNLKNNWWKTFVQSRQDVFGIDGSIISHNDVWNASGHVDNFEDILVEDSKTQERFRADHLIEDALNIQAEGLSSEDLWKLIEENDIKSPKGNPLLKPKEFNLMFKTNVGPIISDNSTAYLRPETAQIIFANFKTVFETQRAKLPFGIAQTGKAFRNEISPREFLFRQREFEQMELEFFLRKDQHDSCEVFDEIKNLKINLLSSKHQEGGDAHISTTIHHMFKDEILSKWHGYWLGVMYKWFLDMGVNSKNLRVREHLKKELSHYSSATFDLEYNFNGDWKEIHGSANRDNFDLYQHQKFSKKSLEIFDEESKKKVLPEVIEPSQGVDRAFLVFLFDAYLDDKKRGNIVLKLSPILAPFKAAIFPLMANKKDIVCKTKEIFDLLSKDSSIFYDKSGSIGRRYARQDEIGTPLCITVDFDSLEDDSVTLRDRDSTTQIRVKISDIKSVMDKFFNGEKFDSLGKLIA